MSATTSIDSELLDSLRPNTGAAVMDLVREAGLDVSGWSRTQDGAVVANPRANPLPNLSRTLRMMEGYGLVALTKNAWQTRPTALATEFLMVLD